MECTAFEEVSSPGQTGRGRQCRRKSESHLTLSSLPVCDKLRIVVSRASPGDPCLPPDGARGLDNSSIAIASTLPARPISPPFPATRPMPDHSSLDLPSAAIDTLKARRRVTQSVREFFIEHGYWEVETPLLSTDVCVDLWLDPVAVPVGAGQPVRHGTMSPEFAMKRLLIAGLMRFSSSPKPSAASNADRVTIPNSRCWSGTASAIPTGSKWPSPNHWSGMPCWLRGYRVPSSRVNGSYRWPRSQGFRMTWRFSGRSERGC